MKRVDIDGIRWPVAEQGDFDTEDRGEKFALMEDENGDQYFGYGHVDPAVFVAEVNRYLTRMCGNDFDPVHADDVSHHYAKFTNTYAERFSWSGVTADTPHAFPLTVVYL